MIRWQCRGGPMYAYQISSGTGASQFDTSDGRSNGIDTNCILTLVGGTALTLTAPFMAPFTAAQPILVGHAAQDNAVTGANLDTWFTFKEGATTHLTIAVNSSNAVVVRRGDGTVLGASAANACILNTTDWQYMTARVVISDTVGSVLVQVYGTVVLNLSGIDTRNGGTGAVDTVQHSFNRLGQDFFIADDTGTIFNALPSNFQVLDLPLNADTAQADLALQPSSGTGYSKLTNQDDDSSYLYSATVGAKSEFGCTDTPASPTTGFVAVSWGQRARRDDATARGSQAYIKSGASVLNGTTLVTTQSYQNQMDTTETDPATGAAWTKAGIDALLFGVKVSS